ncbi:MAG: type II toxin-antitoxin system RelE/ParE family toxin [Clostridia bacterium]|nr:type II toxin-antitoxin system RelE/ParE family toxin [Clostridia bacterium]
MSYSVYVTKRAKQDMDDAADYIRNTLMNPSAAYSLLTEAKDKIGSISDFPQRNRIVDEPILFSWGIRFIIVKNYLAFYTVSEKQQTVYVVRFLYARRNWMRILKQGFSLE